MRFKDIIKDLEKLDKNKLKDKNIKSLNLVSDDDFPPRLIIYKSNGAEEYIDSEIEIEKYLKEFF